MATIMQDIRRPASRDTGATWSNRREALRVLTQPANLKRTIILAVMIGSIFFAINQLGLVLSGRATALVWAKAVVTYLTPFCVSNYSILVATRARGAGV
jgi:hypothetical protein